MSPYDVAKERFAQIGVDTEAALQALTQTPISLQCWQGDDVVGFEPHASALGGGLAVTGNYPGKATNPNELRSDLEKAFDLIPGSHRLNLHAMYGEFPTGVDRDEISPDHFRGWADWARAQNIGLDFNPTCFSHPKSESGFTLSHHDKGTRDFWIEHCKRCRDIGDFFGRVLGSKCITNVWVPDGYKDTPADRHSPRVRLRDSLNQIFEKELAHNLDSVESKLFGIGSEAFVVGSHEFYLAYSLANNTLLTLDSGHYHPTESIADKISAAMIFMDEMMLHVSRGVRWDSDHVVTLSDDLKIIAREIVCNGYGNRIHIGLDYFDASINRVAAWVIGTRNMLKALLIAHLEPTELLKKAELDGDFTKRLSLQEDCKSLPWGDVWSEHCERTNSPKDDQWLVEVNLYEKDVQSKR